MHLAWYKLVMSRIVTRHWPVVIAAWIALAVLLKIVAPSWQKVAADGDLAFLPRDVPSAIGQDALASAFPGSQTRSQMVVVFANVEGNLESADLAYAMDVTRRLHWTVARNAWNHLQSAQAEGDSQSGFLQEALLAETVKDNLTEAIDIEEELSRFLGSAAPEMPFLRLPDAYRVRGEILNWIGEDIEQAQLDLDLHAVMQEQGTAVLDDTVPNWSTGIRDVYSWRNAIIGHKLGSGVSQARLVALQLGTDFTATQNIAIMEGVEEMLASLREDYAGLVAPQLQAEITGSGAVGADMLRAATGGIRKTEIVTIVLVLLILSCVYRAPLLVLIPITSIGLSLIIATSVIALLAREPLDPASAGLGVFTTTRIFVVVLLFGAGTDYCLFFLARSRELLQSRTSSNRKQVQRSIASGWRSVHDALVVSALTTIVGLGLMWFSDFEKFKFSGPIIAISLAITLVVCLTFTPALLSGLGRIAFWPLLRRSEDRQGAQDSLPHRHYPRDLTGWYWRAVADRVVSRPAWYLSIALAVLMAPAVYGVFKSGQVTYDLTEELSKSASSRRGADLLAQFFPSEDGSPITVLVTRQSAVADEQSFRDACAELTALLYIDGVDAVRSINDPLGDYPPGRRMGLFAKEAWRRRILQGHRITRERYVSSVRNLSTRVARFDIVLHDNPFTLQAADTLGDLKSLLQKETARAESPWFGATVTTSGTTVGITDLREVTQRDQRRIQCLVAIGVWLVLLVLLQKMVLSTYLILSVLLSYFSTLGVTYWLFSTLYGAEYGGLDWKVPLFLFVILVAVGQDYNVYLVTRIFEEWRNFGLGQGVRRALALTGGIITSCGLVMAGTFIAMTSPAVLLWLAENYGIGSATGDAPVLRGITELGFALAFGVLLDTILVRSILVPTFVLLWYGRGGSQSNPV